MVVSLISAMHSTVTPRDKCNALSLERSERIAQGLWKQRECALHFRVASHGCSGSSGARERCSREDFAGYLLHSERPNRRCRTHSR
mmetsp:Transcript_14136/g.32254  ORF Transcript_14136/g.32254 Transcript_14136/m.32254 type:complete len:86 (-) Transcript_14136:607-864(-)